MARKVCTLLGVWAALQLSFLHKEIACCISIFCSLQPLSNTYTAGCVPQETMLAFQLVLVLSLFAGKSTARGLAQYDYGYDLAPRSIAPSAISPAGLLPLDLPALALPTGELAVDPPRVYAGGLSGIQFLAFACSQSWAGECCVLVPHPHWQ